MIGSETIKAGIRTKFMNSAYGSVPPSVYYDLQEIGPKDLIEISLDRPANIKILDPANFESYSKGRDHYYYGGIFQASLVKLIPPYLGRWYLVVDSAGEYSGAPISSVKVLRGSAGNG